MESINQSAYTNAPRVDNKQFVVEKERMKVRDMTYSPKRDFKTQYSDTFNVQTSNLVGTPSIKPKVDRIDYSRNSLQSIYASSYKQQFQNFGALPKAVIKPLSQFTPCKQKLESTTSYGRVTENVNTLQY